MRFLRVLLVLGIVAMPGCRAFREADPSRMRIQSPSKGVLYHGVFPGNTSGREDDITVEDLDRYEQLVGKSVAWVYFSHDWFRGREFPSATARWIRERGSIPFIRLMLRSDARHWHAESTYTLSRILEGEFDEDLRAWAREARHFGSPVIAEYGTEVNGEWFSWNGIWNGAGVSGGYGDPAEPDGPERFRDAYRRIVGLSRDEGARNITWVFHINCGDAPAANWNRFERYYPGDTWIDWIGVSAYGAQRPLENAWPRFRDLLAPAYTRIAALAPAKPVVVCEFGATAGHPLGEQESWARDALGDLTSGIWPTVIGFAWWNGGWRNDGDARHNTNMRLQDNATLGQVFRDGVGGNPRVVGSPGIF